MKLSTKGKYGLRAMIDLARYSKTEPVSISSIATREGISEGYLEQIVSLLKKAKLVTSIRGASGGYALAKEASDISVGEVLRALEGDLSPVQCAAFSEDNGCEASESCTSKYVWQKISDSINQAVDNMYLSELIPECNAKNDAIVGTSAECC